MRAARSRSSRFLKICTGTIHLLLDCSTSWWFKRATPVCCSSSVIVRSMTINGENRPNYRRLRIYPLISENLGEFLDVLLGSDPSLEGLKSFLVERTSGNPFFAEEIVRTLVDSGVIEGARNNFHLTTQIWNILVPPS